MRAKYALVVAIISMIVTGSVVYGFMYWMANQAKEEPLSVFVGVDAAYDNPQEIKTLVDAISPYTNLFIIGSTGITHNETELDDMCQYVYNKGLSFIVFTEMPPQIGVTWIQHAKASWGNWFLGLYVYDEAGGKQLDLYVNATGGQRYPVKEADNYTDAKNQFVATLNASLNWVTWNFTNENVQLFTSDYALYWFDYKGGYDTLLAEFSADNDRQIPIALCRGAATAQYKDWGIMITKNDTEAPLESPDKMYSDMVTAYENGAKYIVIFDSNSNYTHGILTEGHLQTLKQFTGYAHQHPRTNESTSERTAFVLPKDFALGFRGKTDKIWGLWEADAFSSEMYVQLNNLLKQYGTKLDVIYDEGIDCDVLGYARFVFWNGTMLDG